MTPFSIIYIIPFIFLFSCFILKSPKPTINYKILPPSPPKLPIFGNLFQLGLYPHRSLRLLAQTYGPLFRMKFGSLPVLVISSSDVAKEIMKNHDLIFSDRPRLSVADKLLYEGQDVSTAPYGEYWRQMRSICVLQLLSNSRVQSFQHVREEETGILVKKIEELSSMSLPINLNEMFLSLTNNVVCRVALGRKYGEDENGRKFKEMLGEFMVLLGSFNVGDFIPWLGWVNVVNGFDAKVGKIAKEFDKFLDGIVRERMNSRRNNIKEKNDFVDVLIDLSKDNAKGLSISNVSIKALILDMFAAGTDTTYTVLEWSMSELLRHSEVMKQVQNEVREVANGKHEISGEDLEKLHYLKAVIKETLRLYPPIPLLVPRVSSQDVRIKGYDIAVGTTVFTNAWAIGRDPTKWDQPEEFRPDRFLMFNTSVDFRGHDFEMIPFGAGRRGCPGISFAMATNELVLANLLNRFDWTLPAGLSPHDLDMTESPGLTIHRKTPLLAIATTPSPRC